MHPYFQRHNSFEPHITQTPSNELGICVVLPSYNEPNLFASLQSLLQCKQPQCAIEVIVVINYPEGSSDDVIQNARDCVEEVKRADVMSQSDRFRFFALETVNVPKKHAGVGLARKTGMDEAAWRLIQAESPTKIITCFDADATCSPNYLVELEKLWLKHPGTTACSIKYAHPVEGNAFESRIYEGIAQYELHLRYYVQAGRFIGHPFSYQTVGSSMACCADTYLRFGGMNKNKAGEDFYFLQKIIPHGNFRNLNTATIYPSPRISYRVPFGTGRAMVKYLENDNVDYLTYNPSSFIPLKIFFKEASISLFNATDEGIELFLNSQPEPLRNFLQNNNFIAAIKEINNNTSQAESFAKRFFLWFDAFRLLKYLNFANEHYYAKQSTNSSAIELLDLMGIPRANKQYSTTELLYLYRELDNLI